MREVVGREKNDGQEEDSLSLSWSLSLNTCQVTKQGPFLGLPSSCKAVVVDGMSRHAG